MEELSNLFLVSIPVIAVMMEALRKWVDENDKLKPYWFYIAVALSLGGSAIFSFITGWVWQDYLLQAAVIYGGQHVTQQAWFKKVWPIIKEILKKK